MTELRSLKTGDHHAAGKIIGSAFVDDPVNLWVFHQEKAMHRYFNQVARKLYIPDGYGHLLDDRACTLWLPPGATKELPAYRILDIAMSMFWNSGLASIVRGTQLDDSMAAKRPSEPHHYLFAIGVKPSEQGKGLGAKIMRAGLERVDEEGMPAYLESSKESNVPFYQNFGFEVTEKLEPPGGCPPLWLMWREPRATSA